MLRHAVLLAALLVVQVAAAGQNPNVSIHLDFDPPHGVDRIDPEPGCFFDVYVVLDSIGPDGGCRGVAVAFERTFWGSVVAQTSLLGGLELGDVEDPHTGWVYVSFDCMYPGPDGLLVTGYVTYSYDGSPGWIKILRTEVDESGVADCDGVVDYQRIAGHAGVGMDAPEVDPPSQGGPAAARRGSWGALKALYR